MQSSKCWSSLWKLLQSHNKSFKYRVWAQFELDFLAQAQMSFSIIWSGSKPESACRAPSDRPPRITHWYTCIHLAVCLWRYNVRITLQNVSIWNAVFNIIWHACIVPFGNIHLVWVDSPRAIKTQRLNQPSIRNKSGVPSHLRTWQTSPKGRTKEICHQILLLSFFFLFFSACSQTPQQSHTGAGKIGLINGSQPSARRGPPWSLGAFKIMQSTKTSVVKNYFYFHIV